MGTGESHLRATTMRRSIDLRISVVIPSVMRSSLDRAIHSALIQTYAPVEILVVFDLPEIPPEFVGRRQKVRAMATGGRRGGNVARQMGIDAAVGDAIAFLDDDDEWFPTKLADQVRLLAEARDAGRLGVIGSSAEIVAPDGAVLDRVPRRPIRDGQSIADYLFKRRELRAGEAMMSSSMLLIDRELLEAVPLQTELPIHQDWDWLIRAGTHARVMFATAKGRHLAYHAAPRGASVSRSVHWAHSLAWAEANRPAFTPREYGDFLLGVTMPIALDSAGRPSALLVAARAFVQGRPGRATTLAALALLGLPETLLRHMARSARRMRTKGCDRWRQA